MKLKGMLIYCSVSKKYDFRVYGKGSFVDYELIADELSIEIDDEALVIEDDKIVEADFALGSKVDK